MRRLHQPCLAARSQLSSRRQLHHQKPTQGFDWRPRDGETADPLAPGLGINLIPVGGGSEFSIITMMAMHQKFALEPQWMEMTSHVLQHQACTELSLTSCKEAQLLSPSLTSATAGLRTKVDALVHHSSWSLRGAKSPDMACLAPPHRKLPTRHSHLGT